MSMTHIETVELGSSAASITFSAISQDFTDLVVLFSARTDRVSPIDNITLKPNNSTANGSSVHLYGDGTSAGAFTQTKVQTANATASTSTADTFSNGSVLISNYTKSQAKVVSSDSVAENYATAGRKEIAAGLWDNATAITSLVFVPNAGTNFVAGTTASLYGIS
jgi:hypothetical protein